MCRSRCIISSQLTHFTQHEQANGFLTKYIDRYIFQSTLSEGSPLPFDGNESSPVVPHHWASSYFKE